MPQPRQTPDRFTLPGDIPDAAYWNAATRTPAAARQRRADVAGEPGPTPNPSRKREGGRTDTARTREGRSADTPSRMRGAEGVAKPQRSETCRPAGAASRSGVGHSPSHPAGRGWIPASRDLGIPSEHPSTPVHEHRTITIEHCFPHGAPDDPVAAVGCSQVFTQERRIRFLDHLAFKGNVRAAAALVGVSHETAYRKRRQDTAFAALWDAALVHARQYNESVLASRALEGVEVPVYYHGEIVGYRIVHDSRLLLAHLGRLDRRVAEDRAAAARAGRFDELLAEYAGHAPPPAFAEAAEDAPASPDEPAAPALPPTREEFVTWRRGQAMGGRNERKEAAAMAAAAERAGAEWDAWHAAALAKVAALVEREEQDIWAERDEAADGDSPLPPAGGAGGGPETDAGGGPEKSPQDSVTSVNPTTSSGTNRL